MKPWNVLVLSMFAWMPVSYAQSITFPGDKSITLDNLYPIMLDDQLEGYYSFYPVQTIDQELQEYNLDVMDYKFEITQELKFTFPDSGRMVESGFNGSHFLLACYYNSSKELRLKLLNLQGKPQWDTTLHEVKLNISTGKNSTVLSTIPGSGFLMTAIPQGNHQVSILINNSGHLEWSMLPKEVKKENGKSGGDEELVPFTLTRDYLCMIINRDNLSSGDLKETSNSLLRFYETATGKELFEISNRHTLGYLVPKQVSFNSSTIIVTGAYFPYQKSGPGYLDKMGLGIYFQEYDYNGRLVVEKIEPWSEQMLPFFGTHEIPGLVETDFVWIHQAISLKNGNYYFVGEIFSTKVGTEAVSYFGSAITRKMFILQYNPSFILEDAKVFTRGPSGVLSKDKSYANFIPTGHYLSQEKLTDYRYTLQSKDHTWFVSLFNTFDHPSKDNLRYFVEAIGVNREGALFRTSLAIDDLPDSFTVLPSKAGYVAVVRNFMVQYSYWFSRLDLFKFDF